MRAIDSWLAEYGESHRNPINKAVHWVCVPLIMLSLLGLLWAVPVPAALGQASPLLNPATLMVVLALAYYLLLAPRLAAGMVLVSAIMLLLVWALAELTAPLWLSSLAIFVAAWIGQFIGHRVEGRKPSFFKDLQFLLIGPLWLLAALYRRLGLRY